MSGAVTAFLSQVLNELWDMDSEEGRDYYRGGNSLCRDPEAETN